MTLTNCRATFGLNAKVTPVKGGSNGTLQVGDNNETMTLADATKIVSFDAVIVGATSDLVIDVSDLDSSGTTTWTPGTQQVETNTVTAASGITGSGNATVTVTATGMTGTPKAISVALTTAAHTTATLIAAALATGLNADTDFSAMFVASSSGANLIVKRLATSTYTINGTAVNVWPADVANLNVAIANGTCTGITTAATSTSTQAGALTSGCYVPDLDGTDFEGEATSGLINVYAIYIKNSSDSTGDVFITQSTQLADYQLIVGASLGVAANTAGLNTDDITIEPNSDAMITVTIVGS